MQQQESVDTAITVGSNILSDMLTKVVVNYHLESSSQAVNMVQKIRFSDKDGSDPVVPNLLYQHFTITLLS